MSEADVRAAAVYRFFTADRQLLYVGVTFDTSTRFRHHAKHKEWWPDVAFREVTWYEAREEAETAEAEAILSEAPRWNIHIPVECATFRQTGRRRQGRPISSEARSLLEEAATLLHQADEIRRLGKVRADALEATGWAQVLEVRISGAPKDGIVKFLPRSRATVYRHLPAKDRHGDGASGVPSSA